MGGCIGGDFGNVYREGREGVVIGEEDLFCQGGDCFGKERLAMTILCCGWNRQKAALNDRFV